MTAADPFFPQLAEDWRRLEPLSELVNLFLPTGWRTSLPAWALLLHELESAALDLSEPHLAQIKLAWWRDELAQACSGHPRHPVSAALVAAGSLSDDSATDWRRLAEAAIELAASDETAANVEAQLRRLERFTRPAALLEARQFGGDSEATARLHAVHLAFDQWLHRRRRERDPWPLDLVARHGISPARESTGEAVQAFARAHAVELLRLSTSAARAGAYRGAADVARARLMAQFARSGRHAELSVRPGPRAALTLWWRLGRSARSARQA